MTDYTYSVSTDFSGGIDIGALDKQIHNSSITTQFNGITPEEGGQFSKRFPVIPKGPKKLSL